MRYFYLTLIVALTAAVLAFMLQNLGSVTVAFLTIRLSVPLSLLVLVVYVLGMVSGSAMMALVKSWIAGARRTPG